MSENATKKKAKGEKPTGKKKNGRPRTTALRVEEIKVRILHGVSDFFLRIWAAKKWNVTHSQACRYIQHAHKLVSVDGEPYRKDVFLEHIAVRSELRVAAWKAKDYRLVLDIVKDEADLFNLYEEKKKPVVLNETSAPAIPEMAQILISPAAQEMSAEKNPDVPKPPDAS